MGDRKRPARQPAALAGHRVLVVDDNAMARGVIQVQVTAGGMVADAVESGAAARTRLRAAAASETPYEVALLELNLAGELDGLALGRAIAADPLLRATRPVVLVPLGQADHGEAVRAAGLLTLRKPVREAELWDVLARALGEHGVRVSTLAREVEGYHGETLAPRPDDETARLSSARILVVDDSPATREFTLVVLQRLGYQATARRTGRRRSS